MRSGRGASEPSVPRRTDKRLEEKKTKADEEKKGQQGGRRFVTGTTPFVTRASGRDRRGTGRPSQLRALSLHCSQ